MKHVLIVVICLVAITGASFAQVTIHPTDAPDSRASEPSPDIKDLPKLVEKLKSDREWWGAYKALVKLAEGEFDSEVMEATVALWNACKDEAVRERTFLIPARLNRRTHFQQRRAALDEEIAGLTLLTTRLEKDLEKLDRDAPAAKALRTTASDLKLKIARLQKTVAETDLQDPEFGAARGLTIEMGGDDGDDPPEAPAATRPTEKKAEKPSEPPASRPVEKKTEKPRDERGGPREEEARKSGDLRRVDWIRPFKDALARSRDTGRVLLVKPLLGGSNVPDETGLPCGGKRDCEGSW